jgi:hypothetical protein
MVAEAKINFARGLSQGLRGVKGSTILGYKQVLLLCKLMNKWHLHFIKIKRLLSRISTMLALVEGGSLLLPDFSVKFTAPSF